MEKIVEQNLAGIKQLMLYYGVERAYLFGSAARNVMNDSSDIDFIIRFPEEMDYIQYSDNYFALTDALESLLKTKVDLVTEKTLKNPYLIENINRYKVQLI